MITSVRASPSVSPSRRNSCLRRRQAAGAPARSRRAHRERAEPAQRVRLAELVAAPPGGLKRECGAAACRRASARTRCGRSTARRAAARRARRIPVRGGQVDDLEQHLVLGVAARQARTPCRRTSPGSRRARGLPRSISSPPGVEHPVRPVRGVQVVVEHPPGGLATARGPRAVPPARRRRPAAGRGTRTGRARLSMRGLPWSGRAAPRAPRRAARRPGVAAAGALMSGPGCSPSSRNIRAAASGRCR